MALSIPAGSIKRFSTAQYAVAVLAVAAAVGLRLAFDPVLGNYLPYLPFVAVVLLAARLVGRGPALAATALSSISIWYLFLEPRFSFALAQPQEAIGLVFFTLIGIAMSLAVAPGSFSSARVEPGPDALPLLRPAMLVVSALALGILAALLSTGFQSSTDAEHLVEHTYQVLNAASSLRVSLEDAETSQRGYLLTGDDRYLEAYRSAIASEQRERAALRRLTADNHLQQARLDEFDRLMRDRLDLMSSAIEVRRRQGAAAAAALIHADTAKQLTDRLGAILDGVDEEERSLLHSRTMVAREADSRTRWILGLGSGSLVLLLLLAGAVIERHIHQLRLAERTLARQARLIDLSHDAIITADSHRIITGWNLGAQELYGWAEAEAVGKAMHELLHTSNHLTTAEIDATLFREGRWEGELGHLARDGRQLSVENRQVLLRDQNQRPAGILEINRDITSRKRAEEEIRALNTNLERRVAERTAQLAASNKELEAFAYSVSHDLRAPLRGIDGWSLALMEDYGSQLEPRAHEYLDRVRSETQRMGHLIDDLLQLSRITRAEMHHDAVDLSRTAESIAARLREAHPERSLEFAIEPGLTAFGDASLLEVALTNLMENAVKFTGPCPHACIAFSRIERGGKSAFVVRDNGVGFDMAYTSMLFGAFQRLHSESEFPGSGIGLATVQRVIHRHGGRIWAEAEPDRGAAFYFTIGDR